MKRWFPFIIAALVITGAGLVLFREQVVRVMIGEGAGGSSTHEHPPGDVAFWTCPMHTSIREPEPGQCPICNMKLQPVMREELESGIVRVDEDRQALAGVRTAVVTARPFMVEVRAYGKVKYDEAQVSDVTLKFRGWIRNLRVNKPGQYVRRGQTLFTLYSPELFSAQEELLAAVQAQNESTDPETARWLVEAARRRLHLWDLTDAQIDRIAAKKQPMEAVPITAPASGVVVEKNVVAGAAVQPGQRLYRIARLDQVWVEAEVYESDLPAVSVGQEAVVTLPYQSGEARTGKVSFVYPYLDAGTRTARVRIELPNRDGALKPDMYANVMLKADRGERMAVPVSAVIFAGPRRVVFVALGEGKFKPVEVEIGLRSGDDYEVVSGLEAGDRVVTAGNFLIAAESRLKSAAEMWE